jgi:hypothetical protein
LTKGQIVLVPRIDGGVSFGRITDMQETHARVDLLNDKIVAVITRISDLKPIPNHIRVKTKLLF